MHLALDSPACFIGAKLTPLKALLVDFFVPDVKYLCQAVPHLHQSALRDPHPQMKVEGVNDLTDGEPLQVVQHAREHQGAAADLAVGGIYLSQVAFQNTTIRCQRLVNQPWYSTWQQNNAMTRYVWSRTLAVLLPA